MGNNDPYECGFLIGAYRGGRPTVFELHVKETIARALAAKLLDTIPDDTLRESLKTTFDKMLPYLQIMSVVEMKNLSELADWEASNPHV